LCYLQDDLTFSRTHNYFLKLRHTIDQELTHGKENVVQSAAKLAT